MLTVFNQTDTETLINKGSEEFRIPVDPNFINKFQLTLTGRITKGVQIFGKGPLAMKAYYSLLDFSGIVGLALDKGYSVFIRKDGTMFNKGDWYIEFKL